MATALWKHGKQKRRILLRDAPLHFLLSFYGSPQGQPLRIHFSLFTFHFSGTTGTFSETLTSSPIPPFLLSPT
jgi:hypothetical protein